MLLASNIKLCRLTREESILGETEEIRLFFSSRIFNSLQSFKNQIREGHILNYHLVLTLQDWFGEYWGLSLTYFPSSKVFKVLRVLKVSFSTDSVPLATEENSRANIWEKLDSY